MKGLGDKIVTQVKPTSRSRVIVKFRDDAFDPQDPGAGDAFHDKFTGSDDWKQFKMQFSGITLDKLITAVDDVRLGQLVSKARLRDPSYRPPNFLTYFAISGPPTVNHMEVAQAFRMKFSQLTETAYVAGAAGEPPQTSPPVNQGPNCAWTRADTGYLRAAPQGIDAEYAWTKDGGDGKGVNLQFVDIESDWDLTHCDLVDPAEASPTRANIEVIPRKRDKYGLPPCLCTRKFDINGGSSTTRDHGTGVLGIVASLDNTFYSLGVAPNVSTVKVVSQWIAIVDPPDPNNKLHWVFDPMNAILAAIERMHSGDVLLLEMQMFYTDANDNILINYVPIECDEDVFRVIQLGTRLGIVIVEAAGNFGYDLDALVANWPEPTIPVPSWLSRKSNPLEDSGAIMVSAATWSKNNDPTKHEPICEYGTTVRLHNYGSRIDCYGWGDNILTISWDATMPQSKPCAIDQKQSQGFGDTSGASAIIAGCTVSVQGMAKKKMGQFLTPGWMRKLLSDWSIGTLTADSTKAPSNWNHDFLGAMPDLRAVYQKLNQVPDIYIRDFVSDAGDPHTVQMIWASPDIIVLPNAVNGDPLYAPQSEYGEGSGKEDNDSLGNAAEAGQDNYIYIRVRNRGGLVAANVMAVVYWFEPAPIVHPKDWTFIKSTFFPSPVPGFDPSTMPNPVLTLSRAITWPKDKIPHSGHYCFVALIGNADDPAPLKPDLDDMSWDEYVQFIRENNNVAWRNFNVVDNVPDAAALHYFNRDFLRLPFGIRGAHDRPRQMRLEVVAALPSAAQVLLQVPTYQEHIIEGLRIIHRDNEQQFVLAHIDSDGRSPTKDIEFPQSFLAQAQLLVHIPEKSRQESRDIYVSQVYKEREAGRVTWRLVPKGQPRI